MGALLMRTPFRPAPGEEMGHEVHGDGQGDLPHQVGHETDDAPQDPQQHQLLTRVILGDLSPQFGDALLDLVGGDQHPIDAKDLRLGQWTKTVLGQQPVVVPLVQELDVYLRVQLPDQAHLPVLVCYQVLLQRGELQPEI